MNVKFNSTNKVIASFNIILKKDEGAEISFEFDEWTVLVGLIFKEEGEVENSKFHWELENISSIDLENFPIDVMDDEDVTDIKDLEDISRPLFTCTNWNKPQVIYEPKKPVGEHQDSGELRVRMSTKYKNGFYDTHLMFYSSNKKKIAVQS